MNTLTKAKYVIFPPCCSDTISIPVPWIYIIIHLYFLLLLSSFCKEIQHSNKLSKVSIILDKTQMLSLSL